MTTCISSLGRPMTGLMPWSKKVMKYEQSSTALGMTCSARKQSRASKLGN